jgi:predicted Rossmann fold flavoprotein
MLLVFSCFRSYFVISCSHFVFSCFRDFVSSAPIVVVGAGAAGLLAAVFATSPSGPPVVLLERTADGGRKILISGGGRCNVLPSVLAPERFVTDSPPHLLRGMLRSWPLVQQREFFERELGIPLALEEESGKLFPRSNRSRDVRDGLVEFARARGVDLSFNTTLTRLDPIDAGWMLETSRGSLRASRVVLATGGLSVPATGSDGIGLRESLRLGHIVHDTYPALTPLVANARPHAGLSGVSLSVRLRARWRGRTTEANGGFLFTHRGYSGPSVLDVSHVAVRSSTEDNERATLRVQWSKLDVHEWDAQLSNAPGLVATGIAREIPQRLAAALMDEAGVPADRKASELRRHERIALVERLASYQLPWTGDEGYKKAEVTGGGVALDEVDPRTLESKRHPGLFLCGEMLDAFGPIGGHNFAWAWATGRAAGLGSRT